AKASPRLKITRAIETDLERARHFCSERGIELGGSLQGSLVDPAIDAILLATPHSLHRAQVIAAAGAGKQVFCEKPLALRRTDAREMFEACRNADVLLAGGHKRPLWPSKRPPRQPVPRHQLGPAAHVQR